MTREEFQKMAQIHEPCSIEIYMDENANLSCSIEGRSVELIPMLFTVLKRIMDEDDDICYEMVMDFARHTLDPNISEEQRHVETEILKNMFLED